MSITFIGNSEVRQNGVTKSDDCHKRSQCTSTARRARSAEGRARGRPVHLEGYVQLGQRSGVHSTTKIQPYFGLGADQNHKTEFVFEADHPETFAAEDNGITPIEYLLVGLASCLTAGVISVAQNRDIQLRSVTSTVEGHHDIRGILGVDNDVRNGFNDIKVTFKIDADASKDDIEALVAQSQKRSAVFDAITNPTDVTVEVA